MMKGREKMDAIASRIIKARQYAEERDQRIHVNSFEVEIRGDNGQHVVNYAQGQWQCDCEEFARRGVCAHLMAMEEILGDAVETALIPDMA
jgi:hypothetical protein